MSKYLLTINMCLQVYCLFLVNEESIVAIIIKLSGIGRMTKILLLSWVVVRPLYMMQKQVPAVLATKDRKDALCDMFLTTLCREE